MNRGRIRLFRAVTRICELVSAVNLLVTETIRVLLTSLAYVLGARKRVMLFSSRIPATMCSLLISLLFFDWPGITLPTREPIPRIGSHLDMAIPSVTS